jgi:hypothetical protein
MRQTLVATGIGRVTPDYAAIPEEQRFCPRPEDPEAAE